MALSELFRRIQITLHCPFQESSSWTFHYMGCRRYFAASRLECLSIDLLHEFANTEVFCLFHNCMWQSRHSEVNVYFLELCEQTGWLLTLNKSPPFLIIGFFGLGWIRWNRWRRPRWHIYFLVYDFSRFHHNNFRDTISWECIVKDDCITSCLIEFQSFTLSKLHIDPVNRVLMSSPLLLLVPCKTWCFQVNVIRIFVFLVHEIHRCKEYCLSFPAWILSSRYQSWICDGVWTDCTSNMRNVLEETVRN